MEWFIVGDLRILTGLNFSGQSPWGPHPQPLHLVSCCPRQGSLGGPWSWFTPWTYLGLLVTCFQHMALFVQLSLCGTVTRWGIQLQNGGRLRFGGLHHFPYTGILPNSDSQGRPTNSWAYAAGEVLHSWKCDGVQADADTPTLQLRWHAESAPTRLIWVPTAEEDQ